MTIAPLVIFLIYSISLIVFATLVRTTDTAGAVIYGTLVVCFGATLLVLLYGI